MTRHTAALLLALAAAPCGAAPAHAAPPALAQSGDIGPAGAAAAARADGRTVYRVKLLLPGGRVRTVTVDGASGQVG